jgi:hypothetical protein
MSKHQAILSITCLSGKPIINAVVIEIAVAAPLLLLQSGSRQIKGVECHRGDHTITLESEYLMYLMYLRTR